MRIMFILPSFHLSWQPPNIHRSPSDFFYPKSLIRRTGRSPSLQVGAVLGPRLGAAVLAQASVVHVSSPTPPVPHSHSHPTPIPQLLFSHNLPQLPQKADAFLTPRVCLTH